MKCDKGLPLGTDMASASDKEKFVFAFKGGATGWTGVAIHS